MDQAVVLAKKVHPNITVVDIRMPGLDGLDAARQILKESPNQILLSACKGEKDDDGGSLRRPSVSGRAFLIFASLCPER